MFSERKPIPQFPDKLINDLFYNGMRYEPKYFGNIYSCVIVPVKKYSFSS